MTGIEAAIPYIIGAVGAVGAIAQASAASDAADTNKQIASANAANALQEANAAEEQQRRRAAIALGQQRAGIAQAGIGLDSGTALDLTKQSATDAELDALHIRYAGVSQAAQGRYSADAFGRQANAAMTTGYLGAATSALSGYAGAQQAAATTRYRAASLDYYTRVQPRP